MASNNRTRPDNNKSFFANYSDHLRSIHNRYSAKLTAFEQNPSMAGKFGAIAVELWSQKNIFKPLQDKHDLCDQIFGALVLPSLMKLAALGHLLMAVYEGVNALAISANIRAGDGIDHYQAAKDNVMKAVLFYAVAVFTYVKSVLSFFIRGILTLVSGFKPTDEVRFSSEPPAAAEAEAPAGGQELEGVIPAFGGV